MDAPFPPLLLEIINCIIWTGAFSVWVILARYLVAHWYDGALQWGIRETWKARDRVAIALFVNVSGAVVVGFWKWLGRYLSNTAQDTRWMIEPTWVLVLVIGCLVQAWGFTCIARVLAPDAWGRHGWLLTLGFTAVVLVATLWR